MEKFNTITHLNFSKILIIEHNFTHCTLRKIFAVLPSVEQSWAAKNKIWTNKWLNAYRTKPAKSTQVGNVFLCLLSLVTAVSGRPKPEWCFLPGRLRWTLLPKECYSNSLSGCGSNTQPSNWEAVPLRLSYCRPQSLFSHVFCDTIEMKLWKNKNLQCRLHYPSLKHYAICGNCMIHIYQICLNVPYSRFSKLAGKFQLKSGRSIDSCTMFLHPNVSSTLSRAQSYTLVALACPVNFESK